VQANLILCLNHIVWARRSMSEFREVITHTPFRHITHTPFRRRLQFYGEQKGDTVFFGDKSTKKFGTYWVNDGKGERLLHPYRLLLECAALCRLPSCRFRRQHAPHLRRGHLCWASSCMPVLGACCCHVCFCRPDWCAASLVSCHPSCVCLAVVAGFIEGGSDDEKAAVKKLAEVRRQQNLLLFMATQDHSLWQCPTREHSLWHCPRVALCCVALLCKNQLPLAPGIRGPTAAR